MSNADEHKTVKRAVACAEKTTTLIHISSVQLSDLLLSGNGAVAKFKQRLKQRLKQQLAK